MTRSPSDLDACILRALSTTGSNATYVIRNVLRAPWHPEYGEWPGLLTGRVLRGCRRLESRGLIEEERRTSYLIMKVWKITDAGRAELARPAA